MKLNVELEAQSGNARACSVKTPRGVMLTPTFMPVGTRAAIKTLDTSDIEKMHPQVILGNTYHLMERPGADLIQSLGGLHKFMDYSGLILTDSGGYQIFSLKPKISENNVVFKSVYDGSYIEMSPESSMDIQMKLGSDFAMAFDVCSELPATVDSLKSDMELTLRWAARCKKSHTHDYQALFGIVQGGTDRELRKLSAQETVNIGFDAYAIGGLSVGESRDVMFPALEVAVENLPLDKPRYFMGLGDPVGLVEAIAMGVDMFDCVLPTRLARHGTALTWQGKLNLKNKQFIDDESSLDDQVELETNRYSKAYIRHLLTTGEITGGRILTLHNLYWLLDFMKQARSAIISNSFETFRSKVNDVFD